MKKTFLATLFALLTAVSAFAQTATLKADNTTLSNTGGVVMFTATASYSGEPGALGWSIALPSDWTLVNVAGLNVPGVVPAEGATGTLEFAFTAVPASRAEFNIFVRYPAGASVAKILSTFLLRAEGKLTTLNPDAIAFGNGESGDVEQQQRR